MPSELCFFVLVADLVASRRAPRRAELAARLERCLTALREHPDWQAPLMSTRGLDELSGVLRCPDAAFDIVHTVSLAVWPQRFRFSLAAGPLDLARDSRVAADMDGPAFHRAANALARVRDTGQAVGFDLPASDPAVVRLAETAANLHQLTVAHWSPAAAAAAAAYETSGTQAEAAQRLGVTQQAVSAALHRAQQAELAAARTTLRAWLQQAGQEQLACSSSPS